MHTGLRILETNQRYYLSIPFFLFPFRPTIEKYSCTFVFWQVNQKMMKSTLIKDLYGEIERLKAGKRIFLCSSE